jgi:hypothetical protein
MLNITQEQLDHLAYARIVRKLDAALSRDVPGFADLSAADRAEFFEQSVGAAQKRGLLTEQGIASYVLAVWWLGLDFDRVSQELEALLESDYPEVRKVHAMNEWVHAAIGDPDNITAADVKIDEALKATEAWGK